MQLEPLGESAVGSQSYGIHGPCVNVQWSLVHESRRDWETGDSEKWRTSTRMKYAGRMWWHRTHNDDYVAKKQSIYVIKD